MTSPKPEDISACKITYFEKGKKKSKEFDGGAKNVSKATDFYQKKQYTENVTSGSYQVKVNGRWQIVRQFDKTRY